MRSSARAAAVGDPRERLRQGVTKERDEAPEDGPASGWFMRLVKESAAGDDAVPSSRGIVRLEEK